jgi:hypothetical protein
VADETDFLDLYAKLRLDPGCSLEDFKQAYRRHVSLWHPDRRLGSRADQLAAARLQRLTAQYGAAMEFHRRHGRLPGAPRVARVAGTAHAGADTPSPPREATAPAAMPPRITQRVLATRWWVALALMGMGAVTWSMWPAGEGPDAEAGQEPVAATPAATPAVLSALSLGMMPDEVIGIEGEPTRRAGERWEYGPSWIRFEQGVVVDWYSSPLRRLRTDSPRPRP